MTTPAPLKLARDALKPCPFCGNRPRLTVRPDDAEATSYFAAVACFCGGYSSCAHKMATAPQADEAETLARTAWNRRAAIDALPASVPSAEPAERTLLQQHDREHLPGYREGYEDGRQRGYAVGHRHGLEQAASYAAAQASPAPAPEVMAGPMPEPMTKDDEARLNVALGKVFGRAAPAPAPTGQSDAARWVHCPVCDEPDMRRDAEGLSHCTNTNCASNGGTMAARTQAPAAPAVAAPEPLRAAAQAVLDRWNSPRWEWSKQGPTADLMHALADALAAPTTKEPQ